MSMTPLFVPTNYRWSVVLLNFWKHALKLSFFKRSSTAKVWYFQLERQAICVVSISCQILEDSNWLNWLSLIDASDDLSPHTSCRRGWHQWHWYLTRICATFTVIFLDENLIKTLYTNNTSFHPFRGLLKCEIICFWDLNFPGRMEARHLDSSHSIMYDNKKTLT